jgi:hypothetical protein
MPLSKSFVDELSAPPTTTLIERMSGGGRPKAHRVIEVRNELRPADLFCYLGSRFGPPNGVQNLLRADDSDNLIHWEWALQHGDGLLLFQGHNFRTEIHVLELEPWAASDDGVLIEGIRADFARHGSDMGKVRKMLESWTEFVNPYQRIRRSVRKLLTEFDALDLKLDTRDLEQRWVSPSTLVEAQAERDAWSETTRRYSLGLGLCFGIRSMLPVLAESFVNLLLYILMKSELKADDRLRENIFRQPIDVRIKSLALNCQGFVTAPDYSNDTCKRYHSLVNERNDLLHGNVVIDKLKFNDVYFLGKVPVFKEYRTLWQRSVGVEAHAVGLSAVHAELAIVDGLVDYLLSCLHPETRDVVAMLAETYELGLNTTNQRVGILFPAWLADFRASAAPGPPEGKS